MPFEMRRSAFPVGSAELADASRIAREEIEVLRDSALEVLREYFGLEKAAGGGAQIGAHGVCEGKRNQQGDALGERSNRSPQASKDGILP